MIKSLHIKSLCAAAAFAVLVASPAHALVPPPTYNWTGFYAGVNVGGTWGNFNNGLTRTGGNASGGAQGGYNYQNGPWVIGAEGDFVGMSVPAESPTTRFDEDWMMTFRGRAGYAIDRFLPYVTAGVALTQTTWTVNGVGDDTEIRAGLAVGGGVEAQISGPWSVKGEYLYTDVPNDTQHVGATSLTGGSSNHTLRLGVNYKFN